MIDFSFDFETAATSPDAVVLSCALITFDRNELTSFQEYRDSAYYWKFELTHQLEAGRVIDQSTLDWWEKQDKDVRESQFSPSDEDVRLDEFLFQFHKAIKAAGVKKGSVGYVRGQSFDFPILANILTMFVDTSNLDNWSKNPAFYPIAFWDQRDIRSYIAGLMVSPETNKVPLPLGTLEGFKHHDPVDDVARAILHIKYAEEYARGNIELPTPEETDKNSHK